MAQQGEILRELQQTLESRTLELAYDHACHQVEALCESERARQLRVMILLLEDANDELQSHLVQGDEHINSLEGRHQRIQEDFEVCSVKLETTEGDLRVKSREIETLKTELNSLQGVTMDSTKLLTEKLTLARELSSLRPEVDHLRSQAASHQSLIAEKLALQRELCTTQMDLETEKRAAQRAHAKEEKSQAESAVLVSRIETLQAELSKGLRVRQKVEREAQKSSTEAEDRKTALESRLDVFRNKLRIAKEQLKNTQNALESAQATASVVPSRSTTYVKRNLSLTNIPQKRVIVEMDADTMIGTPGDMPVAKKNKRTSTIIGEKSTFSITPFLNRTASVAPESPPLDDDGGDGGRIADSADQVPGTRNPGHGSREAQPVATGLKLTKGPLEAKKGGISEIGESSNIISKLPTGRKPNAMPHLEQVAEEESIQNSNGAISVPEAASNNGLSEDTAKEPAVTKMKKRKILDAGLGKTLLGEEGEAGKGKGLLVSGGRGSALLGRGGVGGSRFASQRALGSNMSTLGAISPRKGR